MSNNEQEDIFEEEIRKQVMMAIHEADAILYMVDVGIGITDLDEAVANILRKSNKPVLLITVGVALSSSPIALSNLCCNKSTLI
jgi:predicted GTPase